MSQAIRGVNLKFGKSGIGYVVMHICKLGPIFTIGMFLYAIFFANMDFLDRLILFGFSIFTGHLLLCGIKGLKVSKDTVHKIEIIDSKVRLNTFGGQKLFLFSHQYEVEIDTYGILDKKYTYVIFPKGEEHLILTHRNKQIYISSVTSNFDKLKDSMLGVSDVNLS